jgi:hypothetical protein
VRWSYGGRRRGRRRSLEGHVACREHDAFGWRRRNRHPIPATAWALPQFGAPAKGHTATGCALTGPPLVADSGEVRRPNRPKSSPICPFSPSAGQSRATGVPRRRTKPRAKAANGKPPGDSRSLWPAPRLLAPPAPPRRQIQPLDPAPLHLCCGERVTDVWLVYSKFRFNLLGNMDSNF